jgi:hypothetical protein
MLIVFFFPEKVFNIQGNQQLINVKTIKTLKLSNQTSPSRRKFWFLTHNCCVLFHFTEINFSCFAELALEEDEEGEEAANSTLMLPVAAKRALPQQGTSTSSDGITFYFGFSLFWCQLT